MSWIIFAAILGSCSYKLAMWHHPYIAIFFAVWAIRVATARPIPDYIEEN